MKIKAFVITILRSCLILVTLSADSDPFQLENEHIYSHILSSFGKCPMDVALATQFADVLRENTTLEYLSLGYSELDDAGLKILAPVIAALPHLKGLDLSNNNLTPEGIEILAFALKESNPLFLTGLELNGNAIGMKGASALASLLVAHPLNYLGLSRVTEFGAEELKVIVAASSGQLNQILLDNNHLGVQEIKIAATAFQNSTFKWLSISENDLGDEGTTALISALQHNPYFEELWLNHNSVGYQGAKELASLIEKNKLVELRLDCNNIDDSGAELLANALRDNISLKGLTIYENPIGLQGITAFANALEDNHTLLKFLSGSLQRLAIPTEGVDSTCDWGQA